MDAMINTPSMRDKLRHVSLSTVEQREYLAKFGHECYGHTENQILERYDEFASGLEHLQTEVWKFCALYREGGIYIDSQSSALLQTLGDLVPVSSSSTSAKLEGNYAVVSLETQTIHGSLLALEQKKHPVARHVLATLVETSNEILQSKPLLLSRMLYDLIAAEVGQSPPQLQPGWNTKRKDGTKRWMLFELRCNNDVLLNVNLQEQSSRQAQQANKRHYSDSSLSQTTTVDTNNQKSGFYRTSHHCPLQGGYCCEVFEPMKKDADVLNPQASGSVAFVTQHPILPLLHISHSLELPRPFNQPLDNKNDNNPPDKNLPFMSTIRETSFQRPPDPPETPNFFDMLLADDALPSDKECSTCLRNKKGSNCQKCQSKCQGFCSMLCHTRPPAKFVAKHLWVDLPRFKKDPSRLVPRIVHQTWFEHVSQEKYPNMSRLIESWKQSGWEYRFYDDDSIESFLQIHFPAEILQAYHALIPGAFKADLFRYCALLIMGGVYADMDVLLEANLDFVVGDDIGFMTPVDEPGMSVDHRMCLWNGLIAVAPGHPFIAKVIETVVNNIRNKYTGVDVDDLLCPNPELSVSHSFDTLFTTGPCVLGMAINSVLGRSTMESFVSGEMAHFPISEDTPQSRVVLQKDDVRLQIPGRSIILRQDKEDMGAHRFTLEERNIVVAATDMPDYDDRQKTSNGASKHYSKTHTKIGIYGLENLYKKGSTKANEVIRISIRPNGDVVD